MNQIIDDISSYIVSESGVFPSVNQLENMDAVQRQNIMMSMDALKNNIRTTVGKYVRGEQTKFQTVSAMVNAFGNRISRDEATDLLNDAKEEHEELENLAGGKKKSKGHKAQGKRARAGKHTQKVKKTKHSKKSKGATRRAKRHTRHTKPSRK